MGLVMIASYLSKQSPLVLAGGAVLLVGVAYLVTRAAVEAGAGLVSGNNAITRNQTNAAGEKTTAYEGAGVFGTLGATVNSASGGWFASLGQAFGGWISDVTTPTPPAAPPGPVYSTGGATGSW